MQTLINEQNRLLSEVVVDEGGGRQMKPSIFSYKMPFINGNLNIDEIEKWNPLPAFAIPCRYVVGTPTILSLGTLYFMYYAATATASFTYEATTRTDSVIFVLSVMAMIFCFVVCLSTAIVCGIYIGWEEAVEKIDTHSGIPSSRRHKDLVIVTLGLVVPFFVFMVTWIVLKTPPIPYPYWIIIFSLMILFLVTCINGAQYGIIATDFVSKARTITSILKSISTDNSTSLPTKKMLDVDLLFGDILYDALTHFEGNVNFLNCRKTCEFPFNATNIPHYIDMNETNSKVVFQSTWKHFKADENIRFVFDTPISHDVLKYLSKSILENKFETLSTSYPTNAI